MPVACRVMASSGRLVAVAAGRGPKVLRVGRRWGCLRQSLEPGRFWRAVMSLRWCATWGRSAVPCARALPLAFALLASLRSAVELLAAYALALRFPYTADVPCARRLRCSFALRSALALPVAVRLRPRTAAGRRAPPLHCWRLFGSALALLSAVALRPCTAGGSDAAAWPVPPAPRAPRRRPSAAAICGLGCCGAGLSAAAPDFMSCAAVAPRRRVRGGRQPVPSAVPRWVGGGCKAFAALAGAQDHSRPPGRQFRQCRHRLRPGQSRRSWSRGPCPSRSRRRVSIRPRSS